MFIISTLSLERFEAHIFSSGKCQKFKLIRNIDPESKEEDT